MLKVSSLLLQVLAFSNAVALTTVYADAMPEAPENWSQPSLAGVLEADSFGWRKESDHLCVFDFGDYNGDGILDYASIMVDDDRKQESFWRIWAAPEM